MNIKGLIKKKGFTIEQVAVKMGVTRITLTQSLSGNPTINTLQRIADAIGCKVGDFFVDEISDNKDLNSLVCPNCGAELELKKKE